MGPRVLVLHGPSLNLLGVREPERYGHISLAEIDERLRTRAAARGATVDCRQSNSEGQLIDWIHEARTRARAIIINPAAYTHTSLALGDALRAVGLLAVEVHLTHVQARERVRQRSYVAPACAGTISGFGARSYIIALDAVLDLFEEEANSPS